MVEFIETEFKSVLNKMKFIDAWFWCRYSLNPYQGCQFGCVYCNSRSDKYRLPEDFENKINIKINPAAALDKRIARARTLLPDVVVLSGASDPYQPAERKFQNTRACLEVLLKHRYPVHIITKSHLVLKDIDLLEDIAQNSWARVSVSIPTINPHAARFLDKNSPPPDKRLWTVNEINRRGGALKAGVLLIPLAPHLGDSNKDIEELYIAAQDAGADYLLFGGAMTMNDTQALFFLNRLKRTYPLLLARYENIYGFKYNPTRYEGAYQPDEKFLLARHHRLLEMSNKYKLLARIPRFIPEDFRKVNYRVAEKLLNEAYFAQIQGAPPGEWQNKFWAGQNIQNIGESILDVQARSELGQIRNVRGEILKRLTDYLNRWNSRNL